jgi:hypothetical protein
MYLWCQSSSQLAAVDTSDLPSNDPIHCFVISVSEKYHHKGKTINMTIIYDSVLRLMRLHRLGRATKMIPIASTKKVSISSSAGKNIIVADNVVNRIA